MELDSGMNWLQNKGTEMLSLNWRICIAKERLVNLILVVAVAAEVAISRKLNYGMPRLLRMAMVAQLDGGRL